MPSSLQKIAVKIAHESHLGIVKTKDLLRSKVWFSGLDRLVEQEITSCRICQCCTAEKFSFVPVKMSKTPELVWDEISVDFFVPLPSGEYGLVIEDDCTRYVSVKIARSTSAETTVIRLEETFTVLGIPRVFRSDNGPPFNSKAFRDFCMNFGITHQKLLHYGHAQTANVNVSCKILESW